jgi:hypothetical protein
VDLQDREKDAQIALVLEIVTWRQARIPPKLAVVDSYYLAARTVPVAFVAFDLRIASADLQFCLSNWLPPRRASKTIGRSVTIRYRRDVLLLLSRSMRISPCPATLREVPA